MQGLLGSVAALVTVRGGYETAVAAALGAAADAVAVTDVDAALGAVALLKTEDLGRAGLLLAGPGPEPTPPTIGRLADPARGSVYAVDVVETPADIAGADAPPAAQDRPGRRPARGPDPGRRGCRT